MTWHRKQIITFILKVFFTPVFINSATSEVHAHMTKSAKHHHANTSNQKTFLQGPATEIAKLAAVTVSGTPQHVRHLKCDMENTKEKIFPITNVQGKSVRSQFWGSSLTVNTRFPLKCKDSYVNTNTFKGSQFRVKHGVLQRGSIYTYSITAGINGTVAFVLLRHRKSSQ